MKKPLGDTDRPDSSLSSSRSLSSGSIEVKSGCLAILEPLLLAKGLETWAPIGGGDLAMGLASSSAGTHTNGLEMARGALAVALPYDPRSAQGPADNDVPGGPEPYLRVGAFASAHHYAALARILKSLAKELAAVTGHPYASFRVAVNSRLPEKQLVELSGLGYRGRSDLLLTHAYGPACVLGLLFLPFDPLEAATGSNPVIKRTKPVRMGLCETCQACADACPGRAILGLADCHAGGTEPDSPQTYRRKACIQHWLSTMEEPPRAFRSAFAGRLYGCDACILACPLSTRAWLPDRTDGSSPASRAATLLLPPERRPGNFISASFLAHAGDDELKAFFRKTALGLSWVGLGMLRRNAALAETACDSGNNKGN